MNKFIVVQENMMSFLYNCHGNDTIVRQNSTSTTSNRHAPDSDIELCLAGDQY